MTSTPTRGRLLAAAALSTTLVAASAPATLAKGLEVRAAGTCTAGATWKLKAKQDNSRIQVEFEVDSFRVGQTWAWALRDNGVLLSTGRSVTVAPSGSITVRRLVVNRAGADRFTVRAVRGTQVCSMTVRYPG